MAPLTIPVSWIYGLVIRGHNARFDRGGVRSVPVPVICVGNLVVGGAGKSPMVAHLARLLADEGHHPVIAMRGYKARRGASSDEQAEYALRLPEVPVVAHPDRYGALARFLPDHPEIDCVLLDDGFQHRRLARDLDLVLIDASRQTFAERLVPAGNLREPPGGLRRAGGVVVTRADGVEPELAREIERWHGRPPVAWTRHVWSELDVHHASTRREPVAWLAGKRVLTMVGVAHPAPIHAQLEAVAAEVAASVPARDHEHYRSAKVARALERARGLDAMVSRPRGAGRSRSSCPGWPWRSSRAPRHWNSWCSASYRVPGDRVCPMVRMARMVRRVTLVLLLLATATQVASAQTTRRDLSRQKDPRYARAWEQSAVVVQSRHYAIRSDLDRDMTERLAGHMDRICEEYGRLLSGLKARRSGRRLQVYLFRSHEAYLSTLRLRFDADAEGTAGMSFRDGSEITLAAWQGDRTVEQLERVLRHEGFHQYREIFFPSMPPWVNEGLAEIFEAAVVLDDGILLGEVDAAQLEILREAARRNGLIPFDRFFVMDPDDWQDHVNEGRGALHYAQAWAVVHFLVYGEGGRFLPSFERFLVLMNRGLSWQAAFQQAFGVHNLQPFAERWLAYVARLEATDFAETIARLEFLAAGLLGQETEPETFAELQSALVETGFRYETGRFGVQRRLSAEDEAVFRPAGDAGQGESAVFVLRDHPRPRKPRAESVALPRHAVFTEGLAILDLGVVWTLDDAGRERRWKLVSERARRR
jgi:tetraacyldisaccharide 4'-kinase